MVSRYGYTWQYLVVTGGGEDADGNPIAGSEEWIDFECDVQTGSGSFVTGANGDNIAVSYSIFTNLDILIKYLTDSESDFVLTNDDARIVVQNGIKKGAKLRNADGEEFTILQVHDYKLNYEIWV